MILGYRDALRTIDEYPLFQKAVKRGMKIFPPLDCPEEYKKAFCVACGGVNVKKFIDTPIDSLGGKTLRVLINNKDHEAIQKYIAEIILLLTDGSGAL